MSFAVNFLFRLYNSVFYRRRPTDLEQGPPLETTPPDELWPTEVVLKLLERLVGNGPPILLYRHEEEIPQPRVRAGGEWRFEPIGTHLRTI